MIACLYRRYGKRLFDAFLSLGGLAVFAIPMGWFAIRIRQELGSPVFFRQKRVGRDGAYFTILKFRTLSADKAVPPAFCHWLRTTALDELPQLLNILKGEMSFVGPRPLIPEELLELGRLPRGPERLSITPGLAGLAQIYGEKIPSLAQRLQWDLAYLDRCSLFLDLKILFQSLFITSRSGWDAPGPKKPSRKPFGHG